MAKVTVYVTDDQLEKLKSVKGVGRGGISKMFQAFVESAVGGGAAPAGRYDYARKLMPLHAAIERHRRRLARNVQTGGPPADGGPVAAALTVLLYRRLLENDPSLEAAFEKEFARFGLDELVASETDGVDLLAEPDEDDEIDVDDDFDSSSFANLGTLGIRIGDEVREAMRQVHAIKATMRDLGVDEVPWGGRGPRPPRAPRPPRPPRGPRGDVRRRLVVEVDADDDPRDVLSVTDFATFRSRHPEWVDDARLTPSQMETVRELLIRRAGGDPLDDDDDRGVDDRDAAEDDE
ncbi:MAG TPA: hypothetical protein VM345_19805 [Acidimicrobiales bacterium]|nr:hypothetical protein [Acidimicrobiales bacterium]